MARKKSSGKAREAPAKAQKSVVNLKGTEEQVACLARVSKKTMIPVASIVRAGIDLWLRQNGHGSFPGMEAGDL